MLLQVAPSSSSAPADSGGDRPPPLPDMCQEGWHGASNRGGRVLGDGGGTAPCLLLATTPSLCSGWGPVGGELPSATPASDWLWSAAVPATRLPLPGWRSHIGSDGKRSSEFWAQLRLAEACQPHQKPDTPAPCPRPLPTRPPAQPGSKVTPATARSGCQAQSTQPPRPPGLCPLGPARLGAQAPARGHSRPQRGSSGVGGGGKEGGRGRGELALLLVNAPRAGAKNRGGEIFRQSQDAFGRRRERERGSGRRGREREEREGAGEIREGASVSKPCSQSLRGSAGWCGGGGPGADLAPGAVGSGPWRQPDTPAGQAKTDTGRSQDQCAPGRQSEACGRPKHTPAPHQTTGFCPCRARGKGGAHSRATTAARPQGKPRRVRPTPSR